MKTSTSSSCFRPSTKKRVLSAFFVLSLFTVFCECLVFSMKQPTSKDCQLRFYTKPSFRGKKTVLQSTKRFIHVREKSIETRGNCCWVAFRRRRFGGRPVLFRGRISLSQPRKWGWRANQIRSVKKIPKC